MGNIGQLVASLRKQQNLSQLQLATKLGYERNFISKIERGKNKIPQDILYPLSMYLKFDFVSFSKYTHIYNSVEHFILATELIDYIETNNISQINKLLLDPIIIQEFNYGNPLVLKLYCSALIETTVNNNIHNSINICLSILQIDNIYNINTFTPKLYKEDRYYSSILLLGYNLFRINKHKLHRTLLYNTIIEFETNIFNDTISTDISEYFTKKFYISILNNYANILFYYKEYNSALCVIEKALNFASDYKILFSLDFLLKLKIDVLYSLGYFPEANTTYLQFKSTCELLKNNEYFLKNELEFKNNYKNLNI